MRHWHLQHAASQFNNRLSAANAASDQSCLTRFFAPTAMTPAQQQHRQNQQRQQLRQQQAQQRQQAMAALLSQAKLTAIGRFWQLLADLSSLYKDNVDIRPVRGSALFDLLSDYSFICRSDDGVLKLSHRLYRRNSQVVLFPWCVFMNNGMYMLGRQQPFSGSSQVALSCFYACAYAMHCCKDITVCTASMSCLACTMSPTLWRLVTWVWESGQL